MTHDACYLVHQKDITTHGPLEALFLGYLTARTAELSVEVELGRTWVPLSYRAMQNDLSMSKSTWQRVVGNLIASETIERRETTTGYEYYYKNPRLDRIVERMKGIRSSLFAWSHATGGKKLSKEEYELVVGESYAALERGEPAKEVQETLIVLVSLLRKGRKNMDYETARYIAHERPKGKKDEDRSPKSPRPREVTA